MQNEVARTFRIQLARIPPTFLKCVLSPSSRASLDCQIWKRNLSYIPQRGAKSSTKIKVNDLPQGMLESDRVLEEPEDGGAAFPMMIQQARNNMRKFEDCILLTRVGGFYELYFEHATKYGPLLNLKVAQKKTTAGLVPMAGFPFSQLDRFLKSLVQDLHKYVAISEEFPNNVSGKVKSGGLMFDRKVTRVITPGTLIDEKFMDPYENNFLLAIHDPKSVESKNGRQTISDEGDERLKSPKRSVGLAWLDLSTGDFFTQSISINALSAALVRIDAREIVLSQDLDSSSHSSVLRILEQERRFVTYHPVQPEAIPISTWTPMLESAEPVADQNSFKSEEVAAGSLLLAYVKEKLQGSGLKLQPPVRKQDNECMQIDKNSLRGLEVLATLRDGLGGGRGSLLHSIRRTATKSGARLLKAWIASPSMSLSVINARLDLVSHFYHDEAFNESIARLLARSYDSQRLLQRFSMGRGDADDLISLLRTIEATNEIATVLEKHFFTPSKATESGRPVLDHTQSLLNPNQRLSLEGPAALAVRIANAVDEEGLMQSHQIEENNSAEMLLRAQEVLLHEGSVDDQDAMPKVARSKAPNKVQTDQDPAEEAVWIMCKNASPVLGTLHKTLTDLRQQKVELNAALREKLGAQSLTLRWAPGMGHICHIRGAKDVRSSLQTPVATRDAKMTKSTRSFYNPEWNTLGGKIDQVRLQIRAEEQRVFQELREQVITNLVKLRRNAAVLDELDIACSFAILAQEQGLVRPTVNIGFDHKIFGGKHPTVKQGLEEQGKAFVSNSCFVGEKERIWLITGPNMAGKSTFLRQNALISILAQVGSFVPADHAEIGLVDKIFSRVGSADDLFRDQSTFMVEMAETADILHQATPRSLVIMDEIGRGTTPEDGLAIAFACLHHLYHINRSRTLFATHFHALADMSKEFSHLGCYCTSVMEEAGGSFSFVHRLRRGVNRQSHALKVAQLAGLPESVVKTAHQVLANFDAWEFRPKRETKSHTNVAQATQITQ